MFDLQTFLTVFGAVFVSELGDKTQIATFLFASSKTETSLSVFLGSALALVLSSALAVAGANFLGKYINTSILNNIAGVGFVVIGLYILINRG